MRCMSARLHSWQDDLEALSGFKAYIDECSHSLGNARIYVFVQRRWILSLSHELQHATLKGSIVTETQR
jgi:hypothetical protein